MNESESKMAEIVDDVFAQSKYRFLFLIFSSLILAFGLVAISLAMYNNSGAAQLDLSRPGYNDVRDRIEKSDTGFINFSEIGTVNQTVITAFGKQYSTESEKIQTVDAFGGDPLSPVAMGINDPETTE